MVCPTRSGKTLLALTWLRCLSCLKLSLSCLKYHFRQLSQVKARSAMTVLVINLHSGQWWNLYLNVGADILKHLCGSIQPNQLFGLEVAVDGNRSPTQKSVMKCKPFPTLLIFTNFSLPSIDIGWNNVTCAISCNLSTNECLKVLKMSTFSGILFGRASGWRHGQLTHLPSIHNCVHWNLPPEFLQSSQTLLALNTLSATLRSNIPSSTIDLTY